MESKKVVFFRGSDEMCIYICIYIYVYIHICIYIPTREPSHIPPWQKENHLQRYLEKPENGDMLVGQ